MYRDYNNAMLTTRSKLRKARQDLRLTQEQVAERIGASITVVSNIERGRAGNDGISRGWIPEMCTAYMQVARERGLNPADYLPSVLCPGEFDPPMNGGSGTNGSGEAA